MITTVGVRVKVGKRVKVGWIVAVAVSVGGGKASGRPAAAV